MAILGTPVVLTANTNTLLYTVPAGRNATVQVNLCNRGGDVAGVSIALTSGTTPGDANWIDWEHPLDGKCSYERAPQRLAAGERIYARASSGNVSALVTGETSLPQE